MLSHLRPFALGGAVSFLTFCSAASADELKVVSTFSIISDFAREVGGDRIALTTLVGPDGDAHVYEPRPADAVAMTEADVVLTNGLEFEGFISRLIAASETDAAIVETTQGIEPLRLEEGGETDGADHGHDHGEFDPHAWQSVANAKIYVGNIVEAFCAADSQGCETYRTNGEAYAVELDALDADIRTTIDAIPQSNRTVITSHEAFGYYTQAYGIRFIAPKGISTEAEASAADVAALIDQIKADNASAIFVENISDPRLVDRIAAETGLTVGGTLYSDALSGEDGPAASYIEMMRHNTETIASGIVGS
jgi:zinc/manganese transport system substrate-binding protein